MTEELIVRLILGVIAIACAWMALSFGLENKRLRKALDQADNNDGRDAKGRYSGRRAF